MVTNIPTNPDSFMEFFETLMETTRTEILDEKTHRYDFSPDIPTVSPAEIEARTWMKICASFCLETITMSDDDNLRMRAAERLIELAKIKR